jgi:hypothetical protein
MSFMKKRLENIQGSDLHENPLTNANRVYETLEKFIIKAVSFNIKENKKEPKEIKKFLRPEPLLRRSIDKSLHEQISKNEKIKDAILEHMEHKNMLTESGHVGWYYVYLWNNANININTFIKQFLDTISQLKDDDVGMEIDIYLESQHTVKEIKKILENCCSLNEHESIPLNAISALPLFHFLLDRMKVIEYEKNPNTKANQICKLLTDYLSLVSYKDNFPYPSDREQLLKPVETYHREQLKERVLKHYSTFEELAQEIANLPGGRWKDFLAIFDSQMIPFTKLLSANQTEIPEELVGLKNPSWEYNADEIHNKAIISCLIKDYFIGRNDPSQESYLNPEFKTTLGVVSNIASSIFEAARVPTRREKNGAVEALITRLASNATLEEIDEEIDHPTPTSLLAKHQLALKDKTLKLFVAEIKKAIAVQKKLSPQKQSDYKVINN